MKRMICLAALAVTLTVHAGASAQVIVYDNGGGFAGTGFAATSAGAGATADQSGVTVTAMFADDIVVAPGGGGQSASSVTFRVLNSNSAALTVRPILRFYADDAGGASPGTLISGF